MLPKLKRFQFVTTLFLEFKKYVSEIFESIYPTIISDIQKHLGKGFGWITDSVIGHIINISKYNPLAGSIYIKFPKELNYLIINKLSRIKIFNNNE